MNSGGPKVGFVSLGCPKALVDSERILTQLRTDGYDLSPDYEGADVVVVNTCGFIDSSKAESLEAIGEALEANGRVIVTGCLGVHEDEIRELHPNVLAVTGPQQYEAVVSEVRNTLPTGSENKPSSAIEIRVTEKTATSTMGTSAPARAPASSVLSSLSAPSAGIIDGRCFPGDRSRNCELSCADEPM